MAETPADYADAVEGADSPVENGADAAWSLPARRWVVIGAVATGIVTTLLDTLGVHVFGLPGVLTAFGLVAIGGAVLYGLSGSNAEALSRSPLAAAEALMALPDPCYVTDRRGSLLFANAAYRALTGGFDGDRTVPVERLLAGRGEGAEVSFRLAQAARTGFAAEEDVTIGPRNAERVYRAIVRPLSGTSGGAVWLFRDLTAERERAESAERMHKRSLAYVEHAPFGFFAADPDGVLIFMNARLGSWLGVEPQRLTERRVTLAELVIGDVPALADGEASDGDQLPVLDVDLRGPEDKAIPVRIMRTRVAAAAGRPARIFALVLNRTTGDKAEETVRDAEMRFARFFNNAPVGIATVDAEGRIDNANRSFVAYAGEEVARGAELASLMMEEDRAGVEEVLENARAGRLSGAPVDVRLARNPDRVGQLYAARVDTGAGASIVVYLIDATEQKSLELQFAQSQKMQAVGQLAGGVAHDFNNLLTAIIGFCDLLLARHQAGDPSFADVVQIKQNANRAANLTRQLLAFSRRQTLRPKVLSLTDALAELQNLLARLLTEKVELKIVHGRDLGLVKVDQNQLEQVIINLSVNARDAMPDGGRLTIRTANVSEADSRALDHPLMPHAEYVLIEVGDTGTGIPKENLGKIFEPFYTTKDPSKGTGLGLSTVYGIVKQTGGFIFPYSTLGKGTTFRIYLPRYIETAADKAAEAAAAAVPAEAADLTGKGTILLVEDEDAVRTFAARALGTRGYEVLQAESGEIALDVVREHDGRIDLVVSDVVMPNMDGPTMAKELKTLLPGTPIIFVSGYAEDAFAKNLDPDQEFHFLPKPFSLKQLAAAVKDVMGRK
ncbi:PAS domain-containing sensor histidine kinase [Parvibaculum sp.]|jgi:two-component system, cell cycle sensor histidine kinase and response regulator CckA|uniref:hybrid sensor histidine kinase/response regulator n=1 Tax=Parvibaculum sp. TaxID=2024848 RepID=UPI001B0C0F03|nr:PAS domain-containing sensor histidine kinase [Parvibaculum sp.]MBO6679909.1 response regulator [Parvibaculum sp.]MBO6684335.1 response regulator [Parvibaculum sp.]MBO6905545.1 response regulator [Parvibaculum sp.]